jgi:hypothetical protein
MYEVNSKIVFRNLRAADLGGVPIEAPVAGPEIGEFGQFGLAIGETSLLGR